MTIPLFTKLSTCKNYQTKFCIQVSIFLQFYELLAQFKQYPFKIGFQGTIFFLTDHRNLKSKIVKIQFFRFNTYGVLSCSEKRRDLRWKTVSYSRYWKFSEVTTARGNHGRMWKWSRCCCCKCHVFKTICVTESR